MTFGSPEMWNALQTIALLGIGMISLFNNSKSRENSRDIKEVKKIVDGPLSAALKSNAELARKIADQPASSSADERTAVKAENLLQNRKDGEKIPPTSTPPP